MNCRLSWNYPDVCDASNDGICTDKEECQWKTEKTMEQFYLEEESICEKEWEVENE